MVKKEHALAGFGREVKQSYGDPSRAEAAPQKFSAFASQLKRRRSATLDGMPASGQSRSRSDSAPRRDKRSIESAARLLETMRSFSIALVCEPVLCTNFWGDFDLLVSAHQDLCVCSSLNALERRLNEVLVAMRTGKSEQPFETAAVGLGLVRWWRTSQRSHSCELLGPFRLVIDGHQPNISSSSTVFDWITDIESSRLRA